MVLREANTLVFNLSASGVNMKNVSNLNSSNKDTTLKELDETKSHKGDNLAISTWVVELSNIWIFKERSADMITQLAFLMENAKLNFLITGKIKNDLGIYIYNSETRIILSKLNYKYSSHGSGLSASEAINDCAWNIIHDLKKFCQGNDALLNKLSDYIKQLAIEYFGMNNEYYMLYQPIRELINVGGILISPENSKSELERIVENKCRSINSLINSVISINDTSFYFVKKSVILNEVEVCGYGLDRNLIDAENEACYNIFFSYSRKQYSREIFNDGGKKYMSRENTCNVKIDSDLEEDLERFITNYNIKTVFIPKTISSRFNLIPNVRSKVSIAPKNKTKYIMKPWSETTMNYDCWSDSVLSNDHMFYGMNLSQISKLISEEENGKVLFKYIENKRNALPIYKEKEKILKIIEENQIVLIKASTGSGKSTQIPQLLLKDFINKGKGAEFNCIVTQPRRLCAVSLANKVAHERYEYVGNSVGYSVRFERINPRPFGSIFYTTVGTLLRSISFGLKGITHIIIDEIHERTIPIDILLIILKKMLQNNFSIKIVLMSATIDTKIFENYFKNIYVYQLTVPVFSTKLLYLEEAIQELKFCPHGFEKIKDENGKYLSFEEILSDGDTSKKAKYIATEIEINEAIPYNLIIEILKKMITMHQYVGGSILVFLPGWNEILTLKHMIKNYSSSPIFVDTIIIRLHSSLSISDQNIALSKTEEKTIKIILSTNIAESSITVPNIICVIDSGKIRSKCYRNTNSFSVLHTVWTSQDCMKQRSGRAGRTRSGYCYRLCSKSLFNRLPEKQSPGISNESLDSIVLLIKSFELGDLYEFLNSAIEPPPRKAIENAEKNLQELSALDKNGNLTAIGLQMINFSFDPLYSKSLLISALFNVTEEMTLFMGYDSLPIPLFSKNVPQDRIFRTIKGHYLENCPILSDHYMIWNFHKLAFTDNITVNEYESECSKFCINTSASNLLFKINNQIRKKIKNNFLLEKNINEDNEEMSEKYKEFILCSLLLKAHYPKIGYIIQDNSTSEKPFFSLNDFEGNIIKIHKDSCLYTEVQNNSKGILNNSTPFFLYTKKRKTGNSIIGNHLTNITPLQLLLFGCKSAYTDKNFGVELDQKIRININRKVASYILSLRTVIDDLLDSLCYNGRLSCEEEEIRKEVIKLIAKISTL